MEEKHLDQKQIAGVEKLVQQAGEIQLKYRAKLLAGQSIGAKTKADGSIVTDADFAVHDFMCSELGKLFPGDSIISEEGRHEGPFADRIWILDPLDGTRVFSEGKKDFCVLLALSVKGRIVLGQMFFPVLGLWAKALIGEKAYINGKESYATSNKAVKPQRFYARNFDLPPNPLFIEHDVDSGHAFLTIATGELDGVILECGTCGFWDLAAPAAVIEASGGRCSDEHGRDIRYLGPKPTFRYFVASNGHLHDQLLSFVPKS